MTETLDLLRERLVETSDSHYLAVHSLGRGGGALPSLQLRPSSSAPNLLERCGRPPFQPRKHVRPPGLEPIPSAPTSSGRLPALMRKVSLVAHLASPAPRSASPGPRSKSPSPRKTGFSSASVSNTSSKSPSPTPGAHSPAADAAAPGERPAAGDSYARDRAELERHKLGLFKFPTQYTYGLLNFDDATVAATLHVDQEARNLARISHACMRSRSHLARMSAISLASRTHARMQSRSLLASMHAISPASRILRRASSRRSSSPTTSTRSRFATCIAPTSSRASTRRRPRR